jgi:hypothetical protein
MQEMIVKVKCRRAKCQNAKEDSQRTKHKIRQPKDNMDQIAKKGSQRGKCMRGPPRDKMKNARKDYQRSCNRGQPKEKKRKRRKRKRYKRTAARRTI